MKDRVSTKILNNGATRYGVYDETGALLRYEYIKLEDEPSTEGDFFNKANMLPDSIPKLLGLKMENPQVKDALNVLANVGNLHVWERVQTYAEPVPEVPAGYTLGAVEENVILASRETSKSTKGTFYYYYGDSVTVSKDGTVNAPSNDNYCLIGRDISPETIKTGPIFVKGSPSYISSGSGQQVADLTEKATNVFYIPSGGTLIVTVDSGVCYVVATKYQRVTGYPYTPAIPAGTTTDYLTSTDRNAYPDESTDGSDAYYTLGAAGYLNFYYSENDGAVTWKYSSSISVDADGTVSLVSPSSTSITADNNGVSKANNLKGKFVLLSAKSNYTDATHGVIYYIPADATISDQVSSTTPWYIQTNKAQPVTGHAAIPANTTITYLGQLGDGARIEVGSYVGTGTYGVDNPNTLTFGFEPKIVFVVGRVYLDRSNMATDFAAFNMTELRDEYLNAGYFEYSPDSSTSKSAGKYAKKNGNTLSWYSSNGSNYQMNGIWDGAVSRYTYIAIG